MPVVTNLARRNIQVEIVCPMCKEADETVIHAFFSCPFTRLFWASSGLLASFYVNTVTDIWEWMSHIRQVLSHEQVAHFVVCCWSLWNNRNGIVHGKPIRDALELSESAHSYLKRFKEAWYHFDTPRPPESPTEWSPPPHPAIKINVDASFSVNTGTTGIGIGKRHKWS